MIDELFAVWYDDAKAPLCVCAERVVRVNTIDIVQCYVTISFATGTS